MLAQLPQRWRTLWCCRQRVGFQCARLAARAQQACHNSAVVCSQTTKMCVEMYNCRFALEQRVMELEANRLEHHVRVEDHAALADERDSLMRRLREANDEAGRLRKLLDAEREQV